MNRKLVTGMLLYLAFTWLIPQTLNAQTAVSYQVFYDELSPHGNWINSPEYGYVWIPNVEPGFTPYGTNGHWVLTNDGWTWVSDYSWGWAPFHYGRWYSDVHYGSVWVPGNEWGPGWVTWRRSNGYYGWAPIGPGVSSSVAYSNAYNVPNNNWHFVRDRDFGRRDVNKYYVNQTNNVTIIKNSTVINNSHTNTTYHTTYNSGPDRSEVEKNTGKKYTPIQIKDDNKPGEMESKDKVNLYRPVVKQNNETDKKPTPAKVADPKDFKSNPTTTKKTTNKNKKHSREKQTKDNDPAAKQNQKQHTIKE